MKRLLPIIRNAAAVYGAAGASPTGPRARRRRGVEVDGDDSEAYASPETWEGGRRDAIVLFGSDRKAKSRRSGDGDDGAGAGATKREPEEANHAPPPSFAKLTKQQRKLKKPCIPRPNVD